VPADGAIHPVSGRLGHQSPGTMTGAGGASLDWDRRRRVTPVQTTSQEAWPEAEPLGWNNSLRREPRWNAGKRARSVERAPHRKMRRWLPGVCRRSASFIYLFLESLIWRNGRNGRPKDRPHPCSFLGPDRFRPGRDHNFASARSVLYRAPKNSGANARRENEGACHEALQTLAQESPAGDRFHGILPRMPTKQSRTWRWVSAT
jgi:hypothetical protein